MIWIKEMKRTKREERRRKKQKKKKGKKHKQIRNIIIEKNKDLKSTWMRNIRNKK